MLNPFILESRGKVTSLAINFDIWKRQRRAVMFTILYADKLKYISLTKERDLATCVQIHNTVTSITNEISLNTAGPLEHFIIFKCSC